MKKKLLAALTAALLLCGCSTAQSSSTAPDPEISLSEPETTAAAEPDNTLPPDYVPAVTEKPVLRTVTAFDALSKLLEGNTYLSADGTLKLTYSFARSTDRITVTTVFWNLTDSPVTYSGTLGSLSAAGVGMIPDNDATLTVPAQGSAEYTASLDLSEAGADQGVLLRYQFSAEEYAVLERSGARIAIRTVYQQEDGPLKVSAKPDQSPA